MAQSLNFDRIGAEALFAKPEDAVKFEKDMLFLSARVMGVQIDLQILGAILGLRLDLLVPDRDRVFLNRVITNLFENAALSLAKLLVDSKQGRTLFGVMSDAVKGAKPHLVEDLKQHLDQARFEAQTDAFGRALEGVRHGILAHYNKGFLRGTRALPRVNLDMLKFLADQAEAMIQRLSLDTEYMLYPDGYGPDFSVENDLMGLLRLLVDEIPAIHVPETDPAEWKRWKEHTDPDTLMAIREVRKLLGLPPV